MPNDWRAIALTVDGQAAPLDGGRRAMRRVTLDVRATVVGRDYLLRHDGRWRARLMRDRQQVSRLSTPDGGALCMPTISPELMS